MSRYLSRRNAVRGIVALTAGGLLLRRGVAEAHDTPGTPAPSRVVRDVVYGNGGGIDLKLDLYYSTAPFDPAPLIVFIHGGGFIGGDKAFVTNYAEFGELMAKGYAVASLGYRLGLPFPRRWRTSKPACAICGPTPHVWG